MTATEKRNPMLSAAEERELLTRWVESKDRAAMGRLVRAYEPLVRKCAGRFRKYGLPAEDLIQEGNLALVEAARRFDLGREVRFATYAIWWVRARMQEYVLRNWSIVRLGSRREHKTLFFRLRYVQARIASAAADEDSATLDDRAARALNVSDDEFARMDSLLRRGDQSLNARLPGREEEWEGMLPDARPDPEAAVIGADDRRTWAALVRDAVDQLSERERSIVVARRLADGDDALTLKTLGARLGVSTERVRQIETAALDKMRRSLIAGGRDVRMLLAEQPAPYVAAMTPDAGTLARTAL